MEVCPPPIAPPAFPPPPPPQGRTNIVKAYDLDTYRWIPDHLFNPQLMAYAAGLSPAASLADVPCPRSGHTATLYRDPQAGPCMLVFGGRAAKAAYCNDLYAYYLQSHTWQRLQPSGNKPAPRAGHSALLYRNTLVVFGGYSGGTRDQKVFGARGRWQPGRGDCMRAPPPPAGPRPPPLPRPLCSHPSRPESGGQ